MVKNRKKYQPKFIKIKYLLKVQEKYDTILEKISTETITVS